MTSSGESTAREGGVAETASGASELCFSSSLSLWAGLHRSISTSLSIVSRVSSASHSSSCNVLLTMFSTECKAMKYRRFWIDRRKAVNFYGELTLVFLQVSIIHWLSHSLQ